MFKEYLSSSIGKKQLIAITGLAMVGFVITHLLGNLLLFKGPEALNAYSESLHNLGGILWVARIGLLAAVAAHVVLTICVVRQNRRARQEQYVKPVNAKTRSLTAKLMPFSGIIVLFYLIMHLIDFTFTTASPENAMVNGQFLGLYGLIYNEFTNPLSALFYIVAMIAIGMHLTHGIQSVMQTYGVNHPVYTPLFKKLSVILGSVVAIGFSSIPIYVLIHSGVIG